MNRVKVVDGKTIACVMFRNNPWMHVADGTDFDTASQRGYAPIAGFRTRDELYRYLKTA